MRDIELSLRSIIRDEASYNLLRTMLNLLAARDADYDKVSVKFAQHDIVDSPEFKDYSHLKKFIFRYNGLCELICNAVLAEDLMGKSDSLIPGEFVGFDKKSYDVKSINDHTIQLIHKALASKISNTYKEKLSLNHIGMFSKTHYLDVASFFQHIIAYLFNIYPFDLFSIRDKVQIDKKVNVAVFQKRVEALADGSYIKFMVFSKNIFGFNGHSMLIKKTGKTFSFFDPNFGETFNLDLPSLCECINKKMLEYQASNMAFLDGKKFLQHIEPIIQKSPSKIENVGLKSDIDKPQQSLSVITDFIFAEITQLVKQRKISDDDLIGTMDTLRKGIEQRMSLKHFEPANANINRFMRHKTDFYLQDLDNVRMNSSIFNWRNLLEKKGYSVNLVIHLVSDKDTPRYQINIPAVDEGPSLAKLDSFLIKNCLQPKGIKNTYDLSALFSVMSIDACERVFKSKSWKLPEVIKSPRDIQIMFAALNIDNANAKDKSAIIYKAIHKHIPTMIKSADDFRTIMSALDEEQRTKLFKSMQENGKLTSFINSAGDLADILEFLNIDEIYEIFDAVSNKLPALISKSNDSAYDFLLACEFLHSRKQRQCLIDTMMAKLPIHLENIDTFNRLCEYLDWDEKDIFFAKMMDQLPDVMFNDKVWVKPKLTAKQFILAFQQLKEKVPKIIALHYLLDLGDNHYPENRLPDMTLEEYEIIFSGLKDEIPTLIESASDFSKRAKAGEETCAIIFEAMKDKLSSLIKTTDDLAAVHKVLSSEQRAEVIHEREQIILADKFKKILSKNDAMELASALLSDDNADLDKIFDRITSVSHHKNEWIPQFFTKNNVDLKVFINEITELDSYWIDKFKVALNLNSWISEKRDIKLAIEEYINRRDLQLTSETSRHPLA